MSKMTKKERNRLLKFCGRARAAYTGWMTMTIDEAEAGCREWDDRLDALEQTLEVRSLRAHFMYDVMILVAEAWTPEPPRTEEQQALAAKFAWQFDYNDVWEVFRTWLRVEQGLDPDGPDFDELSGNPPFTLSVDPNEHEDPQEEWENEWGWRFNRFPRERADKALAEARAQRRGGR